MAALASASQNSTTSRRRSVHQRSLPYWLPHAWVRSTTHRRPACTVPAARGRRSGRPSRARPAPAGRAGSRSRHPGAPPAGQAGRRPRRGRPTWPPAARRRGGWPQPPPRPPGCRLPLPRPSASAFACDGPPGSARRPGRRRAPWWCTRPRPGAPAPGRACGRRRPAPHGAAARQGRGRSTRRRCCVTRRQGMAKPRSLSAQIAMASSSNATASRRVGSSAASS